jgi:hypothetical protein
MSPSFSTSSLNRMSPSFSTSSKGFDNVNTIHTYIFNKHCTLETMYEEIKEDPINSQRFNVNQELVSLETQHNMCED